MSVKKLVGDTFEEYFYISAGQSEAMYTLRYSYMIVINRAGQKQRRDEYVCNLSTDFDKAVEKAEKHHLVQGSKLYKKPRDLREITRTDKRTPEQMEQARLAAEEAQRLREKEEEEREARRLKAQLEEVAAGRWPFGKYAGKTFIHCGFSYCQYWRDQEKTPVIVALLEQLEKIYPQYFVELPKHKNVFTKWQPKQKVEFDATVIEKFHFQGHFGFTDITKLVTENGELILHKGTRPAVKEVVDGEKVDTEVSIGDVITVKATVKGHGIYEEEKQTYITRPKFTFKKKVAA